VKTLAVDGHGAQNGTAHTPRVQEGLMDVHWLASAFAVAAGLLALARWGRRLVRAVSRSTVPTDTLRFIPVEVRWWIYEITGTKRAELDAAVNVTNITSQPVRILRTFLKRPKVEADGFAKLGNGSFDVVIAPGDTKGVLLNFQWQAGVLPEKSIDAVMVVVDQFTNEHVMKASAPFEMPSWRKFAEESKRDMAAAATNATHSDGSSSPSDDSTIH
jgi:hypothetical protein